MDYRNLVLSIINERRLIASNSSYISTWERWYRGKVPAFHNYDIYNGDKKIRQTKFSLGMAKKIAEDWAALLMNEKVEIFIDENNEELQELLEKTGFYLKTNRAVEYAFALSMAALVVDIDGLEVDDDGYIVSKERAALGISVYSATRIVPLNIYNDQIVECAFVTENTRTTNIAVHQVNAAGEYYISLIEIDNETQARKTTVFETGSERPWFVIIHPNLVNNLELDSPYPISVFANAIDTLKAVDNKYDSYNNEFVLGRKRVYVSSKMFQFDKETGNVKRIFDPNDTVVYQLPPADAATGGDGKPYIQSVSDGLRALEHAQGIQDELNYLSSKCGLGVDYYRFEKGRVMTATQVISEKSDTFRNLKRHEILLERAIISLIKTLIYASNEFTDKRFASDSVRVLFDDSVIEDKETQRNSDRTDVSAGVLSKVEYRIKWFGEDEETATAAVNKYFGDVSFANRINALIPAMTAGLLPIEAFVDLVFIDAPNKAEIAETIKAAMASQGAVTANEIAGAGFYTPEK